MLEQRRHARFVYAGLVFISWKTFEGERNYVLGRCLDVSEIGVGVALPARIAVGSFVRIRAERLHLDASATVRRVVRREGGFILGLELSKPLDPDVLAELDPARTEVLQ